MSKRLWHTAENEGNAQEERTSQYWIVFHKLILHSICIMLYKCEIKHFSNYFPIYQINLNNSKADFIFYLHYTDKETDVRAV